MISLQSKGLSRVFSNTTVQKHLFLALSFLYGPTLTSMHDYWKNHSLDYMGLFYGLCKVGRLMHIPRVPMWAQSLSCVQLFATLWTVAHQAPLSMGFSRQEYWSGLPFSPSRPRVESTSPVSPALAGRFFTTEPPGKGTNNEARYVLVKTVFQKVLSFHHPGSWK